ncbi:MAG: hypothetical protein M3P96_13425 [Actinomycetota bacterium]|nr:hypothetical protein [Actinomycetota bacterium]
MGLLDRLLGRSAPPPPDLDALFAVPDAGLTLESAAGLRPSGSGSVAFRAAEGGAFGQVQADVQALLNADNGPRVERVDDDFGYTWLLARHPPDDLPGLVTDLHAVNAGLQDAGFGPALLCSLVGFADAAGRRLALVYLYKRGTFYPFAPLPGQQRDSVLELQVRGLLASDLRIEPDVGRWFPVWGAPGL